MVKVRPKKMGKQSKLLDFDTLTYYSGIISFVYLIEAHRNQLKNPRHSNLHHQKAKKNAKNHEIKKNQRKNQKNGIKN